VGRKEAREKKKEKWKNGCPVDKPAAVPVPAHACTFPAVTCNNKKFLRVSC
jgi:hypothetical protein